MKEKAQIIEDLKDFIGHDIPDEVYDIIASAAQMQPGTALIDIDAYRSAGKATDNPNVALWIASQQRKKEEVLVLNRDGEGNPVLDSGRLWMSVKEIADYFMEEESYIQSVLEGNRFDLTAKEMEPFLLSWRTKRAYYLSLSEKEGELPLETGKEQRMVSLEQLSSAWHIPFMELYEAYQEQGNLNDAAVAYTDRMEKRNQVNAFLDAVEGERFLQKEMEEYHVMIFRAVMKMKTIQQCVMEGNSYLFQKMDDFYVLFLNELGKGRQEKSYLTEEEKIFLQELEKEIKDGNEISSGKLEKLLLIVQTKQLTKRDNTRLYSYLTGNR